VKSHIIAVLAAIAVPVTYAGGIVFGLAGTAALAGSPDAPDPALAYDPTTGQALVSEAKQIALGETPWTKGCVPNTNGLHCVPYSWAGGHEEQPGPSDGNCQTWSRDPGVPKTLFSGPKCASTVTKKHPLGYGDNGTYGLDCSGFTRWVYYLVYHKDVLGGGGSETQIKTLRRVPAGEQEPGDLVSFRHHVGIYAGNGAMIDEPHTYDRPGTETNPSGHWVQAYARVDSVGGSVLGYYRFVIPSPTLTPTIAATGRPSSE
jgi:cell wall-associated NlpC family hydrolase